MIACAALVLSLLALPTGASTIFLVPLLGAFGLVGIGWYPVWLLQVGENAPRDAVAATVGFAMTLNLVIITVSPPLFGLLADVGGYALAWLMIAAALIVSGVALRANQPVLDQTS